MSKLKNLRDLTIYQLADLHNAEVQILAALPQMINVATSNELREALDNHLHQTETHVSRLQSIADRWGFHFNGKQCKGMEMILQEGREILTQEMPSEVRDAGLVAAAQRAEHYEIAGYGTVRAYVERLGDRESAELLAKTLREEKQADQRLTLIGENSVNIWATAGYMFWEAAGLTKPETRK